MVGRPGNGAVDYRFGTRICLESVGFYFMIFLCSIILHIHGFGGSIWLMVIRSGVCIRCLPTRSIQSPMLLQSSFGRSKFPWRFRFWLGDSFETGYQQRIICWCAVFFLMTTSYVWLVWWSGDCSIFVFVLPLFLFSAGSC